MAYLRKQLSRNYYGAREGEEKELAWFGLPTAKVECVSLA